MTDYQPIGCDQHSVLEWLAMRRRRVRVEHRAGDGAAAVAVGIVADVLTRAGAEYLVMDVGAGPLALRLDRLDAVYDGLRRLFPCQ